MSYFLYRGKEIKKAGFLGLGKSSLAVLKYLSEKYPKTEFTLRANTPTVPPHLGHCRTLIGSEALSDICEDVLFISPSARRDVSELDSAAERGVILSSDAELFFDFNTAPIFAVTGSDGKSTTTTLAAELLTSGNQKCTAIGNIGIPFSSVMDGSAASFAAELSSFQLMYMKPLSERCVITGISENHLNWHKSFEEYISAKFNIFENASERIINYDCEHSRRAAREYSVFAVFSAKHTEAELKRKIRAESYITLRDGFICSSDAALLNIKDIRLRGEYNILNYIAAISLTLGRCEKEHILSVAKSFTGLSHRCELVGEAVGVKYYDSSIDSSPARTAATLSAMREPVVLILGGHSKGLDFKPLAPALSGRVKRIVLTGECAEEIEAALLSCKDFNIEYVTAKPFESAVLRAASLAEHGDAVLLSPAAASYDEFKSFEERGDTFKRIIKNFQEL